MGIGTGEAEEFARPEVLVWPRADGAKPFLEVITELGHEVRIVAELGELIALLGQRSESLVILDATRSLEEALEACRSVRAVSHRARHTICVTSVPRGATEEARAIEAGADVVWDHSVHGEVVGAFLRRAASARRVGERDVGTARRSGRTRSSASLGERRFRALFDSVLDIVVVVDADGLVQIVNPAVRTLLGHDPEALGGTSFWKLLHADDVSLGRQMVEDALASEGVVSPATLRACHHDGSLVTLEITGQSLLDDPAIGGVLLYARDVTDQMWVGAALRESERRFSEVFENMLDGVVQIDERSRSVIQANSAFCRLIGCAREDVFGLMLHEIFHEDDRDAVTAILNDHFAGTRRLSEGLRVRRGTGKTRWVDIGTSRVELSGPSTMIAVVRDVTARHETERSREMFLAVVAHELRTPVAIVRNGVELLRSKRETMPADDRETLFTILGEETERLTRLVGDALDIGAIRTGNLTLRPHRVALAPIVSSVAARIGRQFRSTAGLRLESTDAHVDPLRFEQVLANLLENAWRHCGPTTTVDVELTLEEGYARISVQDDGPGFPPEVPVEVLDRVLVPNERPTSGIGVGLWLSRRLVESMGGALDVAPGGKGTGARVSFTVPRES